MKGRICSACFGGDTVIKKPITFAPTKAGFFLFSAHNPHAARPFFARAVDGRALSNFYSEWYCVPSTVLFTALHFLQCGWPLGTAHLCESPSLANRFFYQNRASSYSCVGSTALRGPQPVIQRHFVKEYIVTLTDNIRGIETHAQLALKHADARDYEMAYCDLDVIEAKVHALRDHLDHLQDVLPRVAESVGD